jgi:hypothetical protein
LILLTFGGQEMPMDGGEIFYWMFTLKVVLRI